MDAEQSAAQPPEPVAQRRKTEIAPTSLLLLMVALGGTALLAGEVGGYLLRYHFELEQAAALARGIIPGPVALPPEPDFTSLWSIVGGALALAFGGKLSPLQAAIGRKSGRG